MDRTRTRTVRRFAEQLRTVVDESVNAAKAIEYEFMNPGTTTVAEKVQVVQQIQKDVNEMDLMMNTLISISDVAPAASQLMDFGFARISLIDEILDAFERRLQSEFGISPVSVSSNGGEFSPTVQTETNNGGAARCHPERDVTITPRSQPPAHEALSTSESGMFTPQVRGRHESGASMSVSKTPRMEDFGIDMEKVRELREQSNSFLHDDSGQFRTGLSGTGYDEGFNDDAMKMSDYAGNWKEHSFPQDVQRSMRKLGIETQQEVTERFHTRRNLALQNVLQGCTPQLKSGTVPRMDLTRLAAGYAGSNVTGGGGRASRELNFDEDE